MNDGPGAPDTAGRGTNLPADAASDPAGSTDRDGRAFGLLRTLALLLAVDLVFLRWVWIHFHYWGIWDWDYQQALLEVVRRSWLVHGQVPLWNPYIGGGVSLAGNSLNHAWAPCLLPVLALGTVAGTKVCIALYLLLAQAGVLRLARAKGLAGWPAVLAAVLYSLGGVYAQHLTHGHFEWIAMAWFPWAWLALERGAERLGAARVAAGGLVIACVVLDGGPYQFVFLGLFLTLVAVLMAIRRRSLQPLAALASMGVLGGGLAAIKLLPVLETARAFPRVVGRVAFYGMDTPPTVAATLAQAFVSRAQQHDPDAWMPFVINVGSYIGWIPVLLALAALATGLRRHGLLAVLALLLSWTVLGSTLETSPWALLRLLPGVTMLRVPSRFNPFLLLVVALLAGHGLAWLAGRLGAGRWRLLPAAFVVLVAVDLTWVNGQIFRVAFSVPAPPVPEARAFRNTYMSPYKMVYVESALYETADNWPGAVFPAVLENRGILHTYRTINFRTNAIPVEHYAYRGEAYVLEEGTGRPGEDRARAGGVTKVVVTPNRIRVRTDGRAGLLVINQNFDPGWRANDDAVPVLSHAGRLAAAVPDATTEVDLAYRPRVFNRGAAASGLALAVTLVLLGRGRLRARSTDDH